MFFLEIIIPFILSACGMIMISSLSLRNSMLAGNPFAHPLRQFQFIGLGVTLMFVCMLISTEKFRRHSTKIFFLSWFLLICTLIPGWGVKVGGARRWLAFPGFRFQPLEFVLFALPIFLAKRLNENEVFSSRGEFHSFLSPTLSTILIIAVPLMFQPNLGGTILVAAICFVMHIENRGWKYPLLGTVVAALLVVVLINMASYRMRRFDAFLNPWDDPMGKGYQIIQGLVAFANGSITGVGIGKGLQEERYLPEAETDYIFPAIGEEFGLVGTMFLIFLYALWTWKVYYIYRNAKNPFTKSLALGLTASVIFPMFVNVAGVTKLMPLTGIPMPFISAGGSSMLFMWAKVGLLMTIKSENKAIEEKQKARAEAKKAKVKEKKEKANAKNKESDENE
ncbi:MAG: cell division protein FtsW [Synergistaceae bacterium]|nr:cell division protein FtsW [Synergistaceae bacterium]